jgi:hypothetical protein
MLMEFSNWVKIVTFDVTDCCCLPSTTTVSDDEAQLLVHL